MGYSVRFGDVQLENYCRVLNVSRAIMPPRNNISKTIPSINGSYFVGYRYGERIITLEVGLIADSNFNYMEKVGKLAEVLNVTEPEELVIDDEPYKLYYAVPDGQTNLSKFATTGKCEITFICHDPMAYSTYWNSYAGSNKKLRLTSYGNVETLPIVDVEFNKASCFFQLTNNKGETVLVGKPKEAAKPTVTPSSTIANDACTDSSTFESLSSTLLDSNRTITGNFGVGINGSAIICTNYGTAAEGVYTGTGFRKSLSQALTNFEVEVDVTFSSKGKNYVAETPVKQPSTAAPSTKPANPTGTPSGTTLGTYKVVNCGGLWINSTASTAGPLYAMAPGTYVYPTEIKNGWAKHTHSNAWNTFTGWSSMKYLEKVANKTATMTTAATEEVYADEQVGILEIYGYTANGQKLFKFLIEDATEFYEYVDPKAFIGTSQVLHDNKNTPTPRKNKEKESVASGVFGDFNDFSGKLMIKRETNTKGQQLWSCSISKITSGKVTARLQTTNSLTNSSYPTGALSYLGFYIGRYGTKDIVTTVGVNHIKVTNLSYVNDVAINDNVEIFKAGDHLQINFSTGEIFINDTPQLTHLDIGSEFFHIPPGYSELAYRCDDSTANVVCGFQDKFI